MRVQLLSAILLAVAIIEASKSEQPYETLNGTPNGDLSRGLKAFHSKYLQNDNNGNSNDDNAGENTGDGEDSNPTDSPTSSTASSSTEKSTDPTNSPTSSSTSSSTEKSTDPTNSSTDSSTSSTTEKSTDPTNNSTDSSTSSTTEKSTDPTKPPAGSDAYPIKVGSCIFAKMNITLQVTYETKDNKNATAKIVVPSEVKATGSCEGTEAVMNLLWEKASSAARNVRDLEDVYEVDPNLNKLTFHFKKSNDKITLDKVDIDIHLDDNNAKNPTLSTTSKTDLNLFSSTSKSKSICTVETPIPMSDEKVQMTIKDVDLVAFNEENDITNKAVENCVKTTEEVVEESNTGAIVGGVIAAIVIVGVIGVIIWRRKKNTNVHSEVP